MKDGGAILTITSSSIKEPIEKLGLSTVMRSGVAGLVKTLADELAADGIRVNNLMPGRIDTERIAQLDQAAATRQGITAEEARKQSIGRIPMGRYGKIEEFSAAAAFLLSPAAQYITGATLRVDGGMMRSI
jgi:3-oxoacyl-[acyl-carrier protein] reductase